MKHADILYIHGMGGGGDSRIPAILKEHLDEAAPEGMSLRLTVRTYDFDPEKGAAQIAAWANELAPSLVIGESLGSIQAIRLRGVPHILVSPSLGAPDIFCRYAPLAKLPSVTALLDRIYKPREGDRQPLHFTFRTLRKYGAHAEAAFANSPREGSKDYFFAFFGSRDHYRRSGVVSVGKWRRYFGDNTFAIYDGTHFMEEEYVLSMLVPKIREILVNLQD